MTKLGHTYDNLTTILIYNFFYNNLKMILRLSYDILSPEVTTSL